jgi:threonine/homoserine/homoserine lactone efflux protein
MMSIELLSALVAFAFVALITPGPNNLMLMASGMNYGVKRTVPHMLGVVVGFPFMIVLVGIGLAQVFESVPYSYETLKVASAAYLLYLAWKIATAAPVSAQENLQVSHPITFVQAALFQWVNPKAWAMALTAVSVYTPASKTLLSVVLVASVFACIGSVTASAWTFLGQQLRRFLNDPYKMRLFNISCGLALAVSLIPMLSEYI